MIYSFYVWQPLLTRAAIRKLAVALLISGAVTHVAIAKDRVFKRSLYVDRPLVMRAIGREELQVAWRAAPGCVENRGAGAQGVNRVRPKAQGPRPKRPRRRGLRAF